MSTDTPQTDAETWRAGDLSIGSKVCANFARKLERERDEAREQRDRLAEALERILSHQGRFDEEDPESIATEALQYITKPN